MKEEGFVEEFDDATIKYSLGTVLASNKGSQYSEFSSWWQGVKHKYNKISKLGIVEEEEKKEKSVETLTTEVHSILDEPLRQQFEIVKEKLRQCTASTTDTIEQALVVLENKWTSLLSVYKIEKESILLENRQLRLELEQEKAKITLLEEQKKFLSQKWQLFQQPSLPLSCSEEKEEDFLEFV